MFFYEMQRPARKLKVIGDKLFMEHVSNGLPVIIFFKLVLLLFKAKIKFPPHAIIFQDKRDNSDSSLSCHHESQLFFEKLTHFSYSDYQRRKVERMPTGNLETVGLNAVP